MRKSVLISAAAILLLTGFYVGYKKFLSPKSNVIVAEVKDAAELEEEDEEKEGYDGAALRDQWEYERIKDPVTGNVPLEKLWDATRYTNNAKSSINFRTQAFIWQERGPIYDSVGPSNGNKRGGASGNPPGTYTSGRIRAILVDASDVTGNTVWCGGVDGGLWKCTDFLSGTPTWSNIDDNFLNLAISSICQDPTNPDILYFSTGEPTANIDAVLGKGIFKSTDHGNSWTQLTSTAAFTQIFKVACDASGNIYFAARSNGLRRSIDGGNTFTSITPSGALASCTDFEISSTGRLFGSFGYNTGSASGAAGVYFTSNPSTVTSGTWTASTGLPTGTGTANRIELAVTGNTVYAITTNGSNNVYATWQSTDAGVAFTRMNVADYTSSLSNTQGWYNITLAIDPSSSTGLLMGGLDMYKSIDGGVNIVKVSSWVSTPPYVHADQHNTIWYSNGLESRVIVGCDGGLFYSNNAGVTWTDRNQNLAIKQFYSCAVRPEAGSNYIIAGAQDNGVHQINNPGKTYSIEVTGGDGAFTDISQTNPNVQFGSYVYNVYRRSTNGGANWSSITFSSTIGQFINPFDYDELSDALYACYSANTILRWNAASSGNTSNTFTVTGLGTPTAVTASPYTLGTLFAGSSTGKVYKITDANTTTTTATATSIGDAAMTGTVSCINTGTSENTLVVVMSNYNINNIWYSNNGGTSWSQIDGNLPNMPVRWAVFPPGNDNRLIIATEAGVYTCDAVNGGSTVWTPSVGFPTVRTDMLRIRPSDNTIVAATHGRGLWSSTVLQVLPVRGLTLKGNVQANGQSLLNWTSTNAVSSTRFHIQFSKDGINFSDVGEVAFNVDRYLHQMPTMSGFYRVVAQEPNIAPVISNIILLRNNRSTNLQLSVAPNPIKASATLLITGAENGNYNWEIITVTGQTMQKGSGNSQQNTTQSVPLNLGNLPSGTYWIRFRQGKNFTSIPIVKQ